jgi:hypothetical protein
MATAHPRLDPLQVQDPGARSGVGRSGHHGIDTSLQLRHQRCRHSLSTGGTGHTVDVLQHIAQGPRI